MGTAAHKLSKLTSARKFEAFLIVFTVFIFVITACFSFRRTDSTLSENVLMSTVNELSALSEKQAALTETELQKHFEPLCYVAECLEKGVPLNSDAVKAVAESNRWITVGLADPDGNAVNHEGLSLGDVSERKYFTEIKSGSAERFIEYIPDTNLHDGAKLVLSVPCRNGEVVFASMSTGILDRFIPDASFVFFMDSEGRILGSSGNDSEDRFFKENERYLIREMAKEKSGVHCDDSGALVYRWSGINDWYIVAGADMAAIEAGNASDAQSFGKVITDIWLSVSAMLFAVAAVSAVFLAEMARKEKTLLFENIKNDVLLMESGGEQFVYYVKTKAVTGSGAIAGRHENPQPVIMETIIGILKEKYPGIADYLDEIEKSVAGMTESAAKKVIERPMNFNGTYQWIRTVLVPYMEDGKTVSHVFGALTDVSYMHSEFEKRVGMLDNMPGGLHQFCLSDPVHVEFMSPGLCRLVGYSVSETERITGGDYSLLIYEEDRPAFKEFIKNLSEKPSTGTCEYRMVCRDGRIITVSDTTESVMAEDGKMYGYSAVTDISAKAEELKAAKEQVEESREISRKLEEELKDARIQSSVSQMQPHFLYNALASIREILLEDPAYAADLICDFTVHLRACVRSMTNSALIPFHEELENIRAYVNIEKMRFGERLNVKYDIECDDFSIVPLSIQPLVENAIRHGIYQRGKEGGTVWVSAHKEDSCYIVTVEDDGVGFDYEKMMDEIARGERDSTGISNLKFRLEKMLDSEVDIKSRTGEGSRVTVRIPSGGKVPDENNSCG